MCVFVSFLVLVFSVVSVGAAGSCDVVVRGSCVGDAVFGLSSATNAHAYEDPSAAGVSHVLCCDLGPDTACSGDNKILGLYSSSNAHVETPSNTNYATSVCYADLNCTTTADSCSDPSFPMEMYSLSGATNAHIGSFGEYPLKVCCGEKVTCYYDDDGDGYGNASVAVGATETCPANYVHNSNDCDDSDFYVNPGESESLDCVDNNCDGVGGVPPYLIDEGFDGCSADGVSNCQGSIACDQYTITGCPQNLGCTISPGQCNESKILCTDDSDCTASSADTCEDAACDGNPACNQLLTQPVCTSEQGCNWNSTCDSYTDLEKCEAAGCNWSCIETEICSNDYDDDFDADNTNNPDSDPTTGVDCMDLDCNEGGSLSVTDSELSRYNCLGTNRTGDIDYPDSPSHQYYCSVPAADDSVGLCCPVGQEAYYDSLTSTWACQPTDPCYPTPQFECGYKYSAANFTDWIGSVGDWQTASEWCVDPDAGRACCLVVQFGEEDYWSDAPGNVKVY